jgi:glucose-1-phosphate cytidylyltransferase
VTVVGLMVGFLFLDPKVIVKHIKDDQTTWEKEPLNKSCQKMENFYAYKHQGFWMPMDTLRDKIMLNKLME